MRKLFFILFMVLIYGSIFADVEERKPIIVFSSTTGIFSGFRAGIGLANISENKAWEHTLNYQNELISHVDEPEITFETIQPHQLDSVYYQASRYWDSSRTKSFFIMRAGATLMPAMAIGMSGIGKDWAFPLLTVGYGYSLKFKNFYFRPSMHLGIQIKVINIELAIVY